MKESHKLNLYTISSIFVLFLIVIGIYIFINVFKVINIINLPDNKINVVKKDTGIHHTIEGRFTTINLNSLFYNPFLNFIFFSCSYLVGSIIENGIENLEIS